MNIVEVENLSYTYDGGEKALCDVSLAFRKGKTTAVLGGNGAGKSTLFLNINGVLRPQRGRVLFEGREVRYGSKKELAEVRRKIGIVFQDPDDQLFSSSVFKDISFGLMKMGLSEAEARRRIEDVAARTGVADLMDRPTHALSFGQKKRVALAGVLVMRPSLIILDEPTAGLDPQGVSEMLRLLNSVREETGISVVISTHDIDLVPLYCDDAIVLDRGKVVFAGSPEELISDPLLLRSHHLRLPRIAHLMQILRDRDKLDVDRAAATISRARKSLLALFSARGAAEQSPGREEP